MHVDKSVTIFKLDNFARGTTRHNSHRPSLRTRKNHDVMTTNKLFDLLYTFIDLDQIWMDICEIDHELRTPA